MPNSPTVRRMPTYLHRLFRMRNDGEQFVSSSELARYLRIEPIVTRKDIAMTGLPGHRRHGYVIDELIAAIKDYIGWNDKITATLLGAGSLGSALLGYQDFPSYGLDIISVFDANPDKIGQDIRGHRVFNIKLLPDVIKLNPPKIAIICVTSDAAQQVADTLVSLGIRYFWNFANVSLQVPDDVIVQREVIAGGFAMLASKIKYAEKGEHFNLGD